MIKAIHQTWKTKDVPADTYPEVWRQSWRSTHPTWDYALWTDEDNDALVREKYPEMWEAYCRIDRGVVKSDIARVLYLHWYGGLYVDLDFVCLRSFEPLLQALGDYIIVGKHAQLAQPFPNAWMYSPPGESFWIDYAMDSLADWDKGQRKVEQVAGPDRLLWCLEKYKPDVVILPPVMIYPFAWGNIEHTEKADQLNWRAMGDLREAYPKSLAVTRWCHNW